MAPQIGESLREARTRQGLEIAQAQEATKIRSRYLEAMEGEQWDLLPAPAYVRGFLHAYAEFLGLDADALVSEYARGQAQAEEEDSAARPLAESLTDPLIIHAPGAPRARLRVSPRLVAALAVAAIVGLLVVLGLTGGSGGGPAPKGHSSAARSGPPTHSTTTTTTQPSGVTVRLQPTGTVWACLVDASGRALVNGETLSAGQARGPFQGASFKLRLGNGAMKIDVNGRPFQVPPVAAPVGYSITAAGVQKLASSAQPTCG